MPKICEQCGKEHATLEELEAKARGMTLKDVSTFGELPNSQTIETPGKPVKVRLKKRE
jgi:hypothetical protein